MSLMVTFFFFFKGSLLTGARTDLNDLDTLPYTIISYSLQINTSNVCVFGFLDL